MLSALFRRVAICIIALCSFSFLNGCEINIELRKIASEASPLPSGLPIVPASPSPSPSPSPVHSPSPSPSPVHSPSPSPTRIPEPAPTPTPTPAPTIPQSAGGAVISINPGTRFQTIKDWEVTDYAGQDNQYYLSFRDQLLSQAVTDGMTRIRLEVQGGAENSRDYYAEYLAGTLQLSGAWGDSPYGFLAQNDDSDPFHINSNGFHFTNLDERMRNTVLPLQRVMSQSGQRLHVNLCYVGKGANVAYIYSNPEEYAEFIEATALHLRQDFALVPDSFEVQLEPNVFSPTYWPNGRTIGKALVAAANRLKGQSFVNPKFVGPSNSYTASAISYFQDLVANVQGAVSNMTEFSFHDYGMSNSDLQTIGNLGRQYGLQTAMLEHIGADEHELYKLLTLANVSVFQQYAIGGPGGSLSDGSSYYLVDLTIPSSPKIVPRSRIYALRQYFRYVRPGAVRIQASSNNASLESTAFINANGKMVVVVNAGIAGGSSFAVQNLPAGAYAITYGSSSAMASGALASQTIGAGQVLSVHVPVMGVVTISQQ